MNENILIAIAWPYSNAEIHVGNITGSHLPGDVVARYHRLKGNNVLMVSGTDSHGTPVTIQLLSQVEQAEMVVHGLGIRQARVRHHGEMARLEVPPGDFEVVLDQREKIVEQLRALGYTFVALDLVGYRMGSLNQLIKVAHES